jgi:chemotaxis protein methyltransferase CheR
MIARSRTHRLSARLVLSGSESAALLRLAAHASQVTGIRLPESKLSMLHGRVKRRMRALGIETVAEYADRLLSAAENSPERLDFLDAVTTNKTEFFREPQHFARLCNQVLPSMAAGNVTPARSHLRVWCAGCSTGQEPYTLAMVLSEYAKSRTGFSYSILATDLSLNVLSVAMRATYRESDVDAVPPKLRTEYLMRSKDAEAALVRVVPELRNRISFKRVNFMSDRYAVGGPFDLIFFRNVLIYFDAPTQEKVIRRLCQQLQPGGHLFISHSESLAGLDVPLESLGGSVFRKPHA